MKYYPQWKPGEPCKNNVAVVCPDQSQCARCGWNPKVAKRRSEKLEKELREKRRAAKHG